MATALALIILPVSGAWADAGSDFKELLSEHWAEASKERVFFRTDPDTFRMNGRLPEFSKAARDRRQAFNETILTRLKSIPEAALSPTDQVSYKLFKYERQTEAKSYSQPGHRFPITKLFGYHTYFADAPANMSFLEAADYDRYLISLADFPRYNREMIALLQEGIDTGYTHYCQSMEDYETSISQHIVADPEDSALYGPFVKMPAQMPEDKKATYRAQGAKLVAEKVIPEFQALYDFYTQKYMENCRMEVAISALPGGAAYYQAEIEYFTTTRMTAQEIHDLGLKEVARIRGEMTAIMKEVGFTGDLKAFLTYLRDEPRFYATSEEELLGRAALIAKNVEGELPKFFATLPRGTYKIKPGARGAYYMASTGDGKTSGTYFLGTSNLKAQPLYALEALTFHEGVPGHHLQSAIAMEQNVPEFRKTLSHSAYTEGWGLYSEFLGKEMGFYQDPYSDFGRLTYETWRAVRLVVDTGMHAFGWSRDKAIQYMLDNTGLSEAGVIAQIDRYITWPAQALSYKIGEIKIRALRQKAEDTLGENFDLRAFHDMIIGNGSLPIAILEEVVNQWIADQKKASS
ncbi:DUF885 domain-containing protein [Paremcibacter congregatus]|uniref:DUF885 domain-containing protein n=1 Tax=Paremcibacter congregatus TaxID=2043170 RepID=A0A2G4YWI0_9PROT|nr:DUF885 domain-containing protein [Paremcibacter congregatus]QDE29307.1 DUF885 domain-containing protein [Paremcibacter congregatus]